MTTKPAPELDRSITLDIAVLGRDYKVACKEHERDDLVKAVSFLDQRMREIRGIGKVASVERIAVMAALNLANELLRERSALASVPSEAAIDEASVRRRINAMHKAIDQALTDA